MRIKLREIDFQESPEKNIPAGLPAYVYIICTRTMYMYHDSAFTKRVMYMYCVFARPDRHTNVLAPLTFADTCTTTLHRVYNVHVARAPKL